MAPESPQALEYEKCWTHKNTTEFLAAASQAKEQSAGQLTAYRKQEAMKRQAEKIYSEYQANIRVAGEGRTVILKGLQGGRDVERLFLQAAYRRRK